MSLSEEELQRLADAMMRTTNAIGIDDFDGYSPAEMQEIIYNPLSGRCPIRLVEAEVEVYQHVPILRQIQYLLSRIAEAGKIKLTITGKLPVALVADIYAQGYLKDGRIESGIHKLYKEEDSLSIHLSHILLHLTGTVRKSKGFLTLTKKGITLSGQPGALLNELLLTFGQKFNWPYFDGYGQQPIGSIGWLYSIYLVSTYGNVSRPAYFYAEKYFKAFRALSDVVDWGDARDCYVIRSFDRFMYLFGLVTIQKEHLMDRAQEIESTPVLKKLFEVAFPKNHQKVEMN